MMPPRLTASAKIRPTASSSAVRRQDIRSHPASAPSSTSAQAPAIAVSHSKYLVQPAASAAPMAWPGLP